MAPCFTLPSSVFWRHSSAGQSVRLTRERSWVRAPLSPPEIPDAKAFGILFLPFYASLSGRENRVQWKNGRLSGLPFFVSISERKPRAGPNGRAGKRTFLSGRQNIRFRPGYAGCTGLPTAAGRRQGSGARRGRRGNERPKCIEKMNIPKHPVH